MSPASSSTNCQRSMLNSVDKLNRMTRALLTKPKHGVGDNFDVILVDLDLDLRGSRTGHRCLKMWVFV
jgi:hypothetical protein